MHLQCRFILRHVARDRGNALGRSLQLRGHFMRRPPVILWPVKAPSKA